MCIIQRSEKSLANVLQSVHCLVVRVINHYVQKIMNNDQQRRNHHQVITNKPRAKTLPLKAIMNFPFREVN